MFTTKLLDARCTHVISHLHVDIPGTNLTVEWRPLRGWYATTPYTASNYDEVEDIPQESKSHLVNRGAW